MVEFGPRWIYQPRATYGETIIKVIVGSGDEQKTFPVHKNLLCAASEYFEGALNCPSFTESQEMTVTLEDDTPSTFEVLQRWVYSGKVDKASSYTGGDTLHEDSFWLRVYQLADYLRVRAVQVIAFERFETVFSYTKPIVLPSKNFIKELYESGASPKALQVYVAKHSAYWMLSAPRKAEKWTTLVASEPRYGMDTSVWITKLLPLRTLKPEEFELEHPARSRGEFALEYNLDLETLREEANDRIRAAEHETAERPQLGVFYSINMGWSNINFKPETVIDSQFRSDQISAISSPRRGREEDGAFLSAISRPRKRIMTMLKSADHTVEEESL